MTILKNKELEVELNPKGAEIIKIVGQHDHINYMWRRDPIQWANSAPILFPIVGSIRNNECRIDGEIYNMTQHGFSRHNEYATNQVSDTCVEFTLVPNEEISKQYPYQFKLVVTYTLVDNKLICNCKVYNTDNKNILFQIGGHPAFACPFIDGEDYNTYYIEFSSKEQLERKIIDVELNGMSHKTEPLFDNEQRFFVRQAMFDRNAVVVKNFKSENVALKSLNNDKSIVFHMKNYNHLGLWTAKHCGGLLAIEPWVGHADYIDFDGEFKEKEGVVDLPAGDVFECEFAVEINQ